MNRRKNQRRSRRMQVRFWTDGDPRPRAGFTTNLSSSGMFVGTRNPLPVGTEVNVRTLSDSPIETRARVARSVKVPPALQMIKQPGMGLQLLEESAPARLIDEAQLTVGEPSSEPGAAADAEAFERPAESEAQGDETPSAEAQAQRIEDLETEIASLHRDRDELRRYADLLEETRTQLTAKLAAAREAGPRGVAGAADHDELRHGELSHGELRHGELSHDELHRAERELNQLRQLTEVQQQAQRDLESQIVELERRAAAAEGDRETLRSEYRTLAARLEAESEDAASAAGPPASPLALRAAGVWGALAGVAVLGFLFGYLARPSTPTAEGIEAAATTGTAMPAGATSDPAEQVAANRATTREAAPGEVVDAPTRRADSPPPPVEPDLSGVQPTVEAWASAWSRQDVDAYLSHYSIDFMPAGGTGREAWQTQRRERLLRPASISIELSAVEIEEAGLGRALATFDQSYRADRYADRVRKTLELGWEDGSWRIVAERSAPVG